MSNELESLRKAHDQALEDLIELQTKDEQLNGSIIIASKQRSEEREQLIQTHSRELSMKLDQIKQLTLALENGPTPSQLSEMERALVSTQEELKTSKLEQQSLAVVLQSREEVLASTVKEKEEILGLKDKLESEVKLLREEADKQVKRAQDDSAEALRRSDEEYYTAVSKLCNQHEEALRSREEKAQQDLDRMRNEFEAQIRQAELARQGMLADSQTAQTDVIDKLQAEHASTIARVRDECSSDLEHLKTEQTKSMIDMQNEHAERFSKLKAQHSTLDSLNQELKSSMEDLRAELKSQAIEFENTLMDIQTEKTRELDSLRMRIKDLEFETGQLIQEHASAIEKTRKLHDASKASVVEEHLQASTQSRLEHQQAISDLLEQLMGKEGTHKKELEQSRQRHEQQLSEERTRSQEARELVRQSTASEVQMWEKDRNLFLNEVESLKRALLEATESQRELVEANVTLSKDHEELRAAHLEVLQNFDEAKKLRATSESHLASLQSEHQRSTLTTQKLESRCRIAEDAAKTAEKTAMELQQMHLDMRGAADRIEQLTKEKSSTESTIRDLQSQLAALQNRLSLVQDVSIQRPIIERTLSHSRPNGLPPAKLPPLSPPPSIPPPPLPPNAPPVQSENGHASMSSISSRGRASTGSQETHDTVPTSTGSVNGILDDVTTNGDQTQTRLIEEQEAMIKTLNKQLAHCETDLQAHIDLVATLESSLNDSERNCELCIPSQFFSKLILIFQCVKLASSLMKSAARKIRWCGNWRRHEMKFEKSSENWQMLDSL